MTLKKRMENKYYFMFKFHFNTSFSFIISFYLIICWEWSLFNEMILEKLKLIDLWTKKWNEMKIYNEKIYFLHLTSTAQRPSPLSIIYHLQIIIILMFNSIFNWTQFIYLRIFIFSVNGQWSSFNIAKWEPLFRFHPNLMTMEKRKERNGHFLSDMKTKTPRAIGGIWSDFNSIQI